MLMTLTQRSLAKLFISAIVCGLWLPSPFVIAQSQSDAPMQLSLAQSIDLALKQNRDLKLAQRRRRQRQAGDA